MKKNLIVLTLCLLSINLFGQVLNADFSDPFNSSTKTKTFSATLIGMTDKFLFLRQAEKNHYAIKKLSKETFELISEVVIPATSLPIEKLFFNKNGIYLFSKDEEKGKVNLGALVYNLDLELISANKKVHSYSKKEEVLEIISQDEGANLMFVISKVKAKELVCNYQILNPSLEFEDAGSFNLSDYFETEMEFDQINIEAFLKRLQYLANNELITTIKVVNSKDKKAPPRYELVFMNCQNKNIKNVSLSLGSKHELNNMNFLIEGDLLTVTGFYSTIDSRGKNFIFDGIYMQKFDMKNIDEPLLVSKSSIPSKLISEINKNDVLDKSAAKSKDLSDYYKINDIFYHENNTATIFLEYIQNYVRTTTTTNGGVSSTSSYPVSARGNILIFNVNTETGEYISGDFIKKRTVKTHSYSFFDEITTLVLENKNKPDEFTILFESDRLFNPKDKDDNKGIKLKYKKLEQNFHTAVYNTESMSCEVFPPKPAMKKVDLTKKISITNCILDSKQNVFYSINTKAEYSGGQKAIAYASIPLLLSGYVSLAMKPTYQYTISKVTF